MSDTPAKTCHIRSWAEEGRDRDGKFLIAYCFSCERHNARARYGSRAARLRGIVEHRALFDGK